MKKKNKLIIIFLVIILFFGTGITYSMFISNASLTSTNQSIAKFVFDTKTLDEINISLDDLKPGDEKNYSFSIANSDEKVSDVNIEYQMIIKTYHLIPTTIELYKVLENNDEELVLSCNETYTRNTQNEIVCNSQIFEMDHSSTITDNYKLKVGISSEYNNLEYSDLIDYIDIEINSWQKLGA